MSDEAIRHLHVICYRWGHRYSVDYVNILRAMVARQLSLPHTFHCITDSTAGLHPDVVAHDLPDLGIAGIWRKLMTFQEDFLGLKGEHILSMDIDVVVVGHLDFVVDRPEVDFMIARNWSRRGAGGSGSLYRLRVGSMPHVWQRFIDDPSAAIDRYHGKDRDIGEQNWLAANVGEFTYFEDGKVVSYKRHCGARGHHLLGALGRRIDLTTARFGKACPPAGAAMVSFHGDPLPPDVMHRHHGRWRQAPFVAEHWHE